MQDVDFWEDFEVLTIETPELLELRLPLAGFGPRALAWFLDNLILGVASTILLILVIAAMSDTIFGRGSGGGHGMLVFMVLVGVVLLFSPVFYYVLFEYFWNGQTLGKRWLGIRVIRRGGLPLGFGQVLIRNLLRLIDYLPTNYLAGLIAFFATKYQQRIGDLAADTVVIREFRSRQPYNWAGTPQALAIRPQAAGLATPAIAYAAGAYLERSANLPQEVRLRITDELIRRLGYSAATLSLREREDYLASVLYTRPGLA
jgi:uncharacterized RDD family membrane protein YckC